MNRLRVVLTAILCYVCVLVVKKNHYYDNDDYNNNDDYHNYHDNYRVDLADVDVSGDFADIENSGDRNDTRFHLTDSHLLEADIREEMEQHLSNIASYSFVASEELESLLSSDCYVKKMYMIMQHGGSYPNKKLSKQFEKLKQKILSDTNLPDSVRRCFSALSYKKIGLTESGKDDIRALGVRLTKRYPSIFERDGSVDRYEFMSDPYGIYKQSARVFMGALSRETGTSIEDLPLLEDSTISFLTGNCSKSLLKSKQDSFKRIKEVEKKFFDESKGLTPHELRLVYEAYAYETAERARLQQTSIWILLLDLVRVKTQDYLTDLFKYYKDGPDKKENYRPLCLYLQKIVSFFDDKETAIKAKFSFVRNGMFLKLLTLLRPDYYKDETILNGQYDTPRKWKLTEIGGFTSNILFLLYVRGGEDHIAVVHQERTISIRGCDNHLCKYSQFQDSYREELKCDANDVCGTPIGS